MGPKDACRMANRVGPDHTDQEQSDLGLHCLPRPISPKTLNHYGIAFISMILSLQQTTKVLIRLRGCAG